MPNPKKPVPIVPGVSASPGQLGEEARSELDQAQKELKEIDLLLQQTSTEVDRLVQRNAQATSALKQLEASLDTVPRVDLQAAYTAVLDAQKRLFMMRGQLEKLQSDQHNIGRYVDYLRKVTDSLHPGADRPGSSAMPAGLEADAGGQSSIVRIIEAQEQERQRLVRHAMLNEQNPGSRLNSINAMDTETPVQYDSDVKNALITVVMTDENPGVRREALKLMGKFQYEESIKETLLYVVTNDTVSGLRIEALNSLMLKQEVKATN